jgi:hypothetical protein
MVTFRVDYILCKSAFFFEETIYKHFKLILAPNSVNRRAKGANKMNGSKMHIDGLRGF